MQWTRRLIELARAGETTVGRRRFAIALITLSSVSFSFGGLLLRGMQDADVWQINLYRSLAQFVVVFAMIVFANGRGSLNVMLGIGRYGVIAGVLIGFIPILFVISMQNTTVANTLFVISSVPVITALLARVVLGERIRTGTRVAIVLAMTGIGIMVADGVAAGSILGNATALLTAVLFSCFAVIVRAKRNINMLPTIAFGSLMTCVTCVLITGHDLGISWYDFLLCMIWGAVIGGLFGNVLFVVAARHLAAAEVTLLMLTEFVLGPLWVWLFIAEVPTSYTLIGGAIVLSAVAGRALVDLRRAPRRR